MAGLLLRTIWLLYLRDNPAAELMTLVAAIIYIINIFIYYIYDIYYIIDYIIYIYYIYYIYIYLVSIYICIFVYFYIGQSFKEVNLAGIKNCLTLVVKVKSLKSITSRQCH